MNHTMNPLIEIGDQRMGYNQQMAVSCTCGWVERYWISVNSDRTKGEQLWVTHLESLRPDEPPPPVPDIGEA